MDKRLQSYSETISNTYDRYLGPYQRKLENVHQLTRRLQQKLLYASAKLYDGYVATRPYIRKIAKQLQRLGPIVSRYITTPLGNARREYFDPHVAQIWERVLELSSGMAGLYPAPTETVQSGFSSTFVLEPDAEAPTTAFSPPPVPAPTDNEANSFISIVSTTIGSQTPATTDYTTSSVEVQSSHPSDIISDTPSSLLFDVLETATDVISSIIITSEAAQYAQSFIITPVPTEIINETVLDTSSVREYNTEEILSPSPTPPADAEMLDQETLMPATTIALEVPSRTSDDDTTEVDLDEFYASLGLEVEEDDTSSASEVLTPIPEPVKEETEEEKAERARIKALETAEKRKQLEVRHTHWETQLEQMIKMQRKALRSALVALRKAAAAELKNSTEMRGAIETLHREAEKALKGTEAYSTKLRQEEKTDEEKLNLWGRLVGKVEEKFQERLGQVEFVVNQWYGTVLQEEYQEVRIFCRRSFIFI